MTYLLQNEPLSFNSTFFRQLTKTKTAETVTFGVKLQLKSQCAMVGTIFRFGCIEMP